jgi:hypothetical protein
MAQRSTTSIPLIIVALIIVLLVLSLVHRPQTKQTGPPVATSHVGLPSLYPDPALTPGAIDSRVSQATISETICVSGWTKTVRPPTHLTNAIKSDLMSMRGLDDASAYELDHFIPLELGGCSDCKANLWLEPYEPQPGARQKDKVENFLHHQVCTGAMSLQEAQRAIATDWYKIYVQITPATAP